MVWSVRSRRLASSFVLSMVSLSAACSRQETDRPETIRPVKTIAVAGATEPDTHTFPGRVDASRQVELVFQVPGVLVHLPVKEAQRVTKGEIIAQLRRDEFQARLDTAQAQLDQAKANLGALRLGERPEEQFRREAAVRAAAAKLANAKTELERYARLVKSSAVSQSEYELAQTAYTVAQEEHLAAVQLFQKGTAARREEIKAQEAVVRGLEGRRADAKLQLTDSTLLAPNDGVIAQRLVEEGQSIQVNQPLVRLQSTGTIDVVVDVPEAVMANDIRSLDITGMAAEISSVPGRRYPVRINEIAQVADPVTQTFPVRFEMRSPSGVTILPGMTATVTVNYRRSRGDRILVPISAVCKLDTGEQAVWVLGPDGIVRARRVAMGVARHGDVEILQGLSPGDRIVVAGVTFLREGMKVRDLGNALGG